MLTITTTKNLFEKLLPHFRKVKRESKTKVYLNYGRNGISDLIKVYSEFFKSIANLQHRKIELMTDLKCNLLE